MKAHKEIGKGAKGTAKCGQLDLTEPMTPQSVIWEGPTCWWRLEWTFTLSLQPRPPKWFHIKILGYSRPGSMNTFHWCLLLQFNLDNLQGCKVKKQVSQWMKKLTCLKVPNLEACFLSGNLFYTRGSLMHPHVICNFQLVILCYKIADRIWMNKTYKIPLRLNNDILLKKQTHCMSLRSVLRTWSYVDCLEVSKCKIQLVVLKNCTNSMVPND